MKYRIQQKCNSNRIINETDVFSSSCHLTYSSSTKKFDMGDYYHTMNQNIVPYVSSNNTIFVVNASNAGSNNSAEGKVFVVSDIANKNTVSYSEDYGYLYYFARQYNTISDLLYTSNNNISTQRLQNSEIEIEEDIPASDS